MTELEMKYLSLDLLVLVNSERFKEKKFIHEQHDMILDKLKSNDNTIQH